MKSIRDLIDNNRSEMYRIYPLNQKYFDIIDDEYKAYWLGLLYADGCNKDDRGSWSIELQEQDKYLLDGLNKSLNCEKPLLFRDLKSKKPNWSNSYTLEINSKYMCERLTELGCHPRKSLTLKFPTENQVPVHLLQHFIRGYIDGDGCIFYLKKENVYQFL